MNGYGGVARYFDGEYDDFRQDVRFFIETLANQRSRGPVLDGGCGTGRVAVPLTEAGFRVTGIDSSQAMLQRARRRRRALAPELKLRLRFSCQDLCRFSFRQRFQSAILAFSTFNLLVDPASRRACLARLADALELGGLLLVDMATPAQLGTRAPAAVRHSSSSFRQRPWGHLVEKTVEEEDAPDGAATVVRYHFVKRRQADARPLAEHRVEFSLARLERRATEELFYAAGFDVEEVFGDYLRRPFGERSPRMIFQARKVL